MRLTLREFRHDRTMEWFEEETGEGSSCHTAVLLNYGKCVYWLGHDKTILEKGDVLLIPAGVSYYAKSVPSVFHEKFVIRFDAAGESGRLPLLGRQVGTKLRPSMFEWSSSRLQTIAEERADRAAFADVRAEAILAELLALWSREWSAGPVTAAVDAHALRMKDYILEHYREKITKEELAAHIGRSPNYAAALFRRATGQTISEYVHATRIKKAVYLLSDSLLTVGEISDLLGYPDVSYFHRLFKRATGKTPSDLMKERRG